MLEDNIRNYEIKTVKKDLVLQFGDSHDGIIEFVGIVKNGYVELGYFYGDNKPKNIIDISTQVGCPVKCSFCELGNKPFSRNLEALEIYEQVILMLKQASQYGFDINNINHKIDFAKSGEPLFNPNFLKSLGLISEFEFSYKISTIFPQGKIRMFHDIADFTSKYDNYVQMQISLISTNEEYRNRAAGIKLASFSEIRDCAEYWKLQNPNGRKINLSLILSEDNPVDVDDVCGYFSSELFRFRFRNYMPTENGNSSNLVTITRAKLENLMKQFSDYGYEVGTWATPTLIEQKFGLAANVTLSRYLKMIGK